LLKYPTPSSEKWATFPCFSPLLGEAGGKEKERKKGELEEWRKRKEEEELLSALYKFAPTAYF
jgi:hypothetical protein